MLLLVSDLVDCLWVLIVYGVAFSFVSRPFQPADLQTSVDMSVVPTSMWVQFMFLDEACE